MNADEIDRALACLPEHQPAPPPPARSAGTAALAVATALRVVPSLPAAAAPERNPTSLQDRRGRIAETRAELERKRIRHPGLLAELRRLDTRCGLVLGPTGVGKTAAALWAQARHSGLWVHARDLGACERRHALGKGKPAMLERALETTVLYVDDLGSEETQDLGVLQYVIDQRYAAQPPRATFATSGLTAAEQSAYLGAPYVRRLVEQHVPKPSGGVWPVLYVDAHGGGHG
jgi:hypothetical protein